MNMRSQSVLSKTNLLRWMINLLLLPPAIASATAHAQDAWQIDPNDSIATLTYLHKQLDVTPEPSFVD
jgi:hypothetical protein